MERRRFGPSHREVPVIGQGTWRLEEAERAPAIAALRRGIDLGMTHVDTAELYGGGAVEELVGEAIAGRRHDVFLVSKLMPQHASRSGTVAACERSLRRLRTDRLDCYLLHWRGEQPLEETVAAFARLQDAGKILSWGVSNFDVIDLDAVWKLAPEGQLVCNQVLYHLRERGIEHAVLPWCEKHEVAVVGYSPFGSGRFPGPRAKGGRVLRDIGRAHRASTRQVALRFLVRRPALFAIPRAARLEHTEDNARAGDLRLAPDELARIEAALPLGAPPRALPTL
jgi:diketogulonate reductase-like aldo/keto reductase